MTQVLDTKVDGSGYKILDTQTIGSSAGYISTNIGGADADGIVAIIKLPRVISAIPASASASGVVFTLGHGLFITTVVANSTANGITAILRRGFTISTAPGGASASGVTSIVGGTSYVDYFAIKLRHKTTGAPLVGLTTVTITLYQPSTGYRLDFADGQFKPSPATPSATMGELSSTNHPGTYRIPITVMGWLGWVNWEATYNDGTYTYSSSGERYYVANVRVDSVPPTGVAMATAVWSFPTTSSATAGTMGAWVTNKVLTVSKFLGLK